MNSLHFAHLRIDGENGVKLAEFVEKSHLSEICLKEVEIDTEVLNKIMLGCEKGQKLRVLNMTCTQLEK